MKLTIKTMVALVLLVFTACKNESKKGKTMQDDATTEMEVENAYDIPESWVAKRVAKAKERLNASDAGKILWNGIEAQGGLEKWFNNGYFSFQFDYQPLDGSTRRNSYQTIDTWNNKARHNSIEDTTAIFGWDGKEAWVKAKEELVFKYDTKFWALTPIYLFAHPFVLDGEGVNLELLKERKYKGAVQDVIKVTFASGTGDAPDDYYKLYFDKETHRMSAILYIVSYPGYFPNGGHSPEKILEIVDWTTVKGIKLPTTLKTHWSKEGDLGEYITKIDISNISFSPEVPENYFSKPEGAKILE